MKLKFSGCQKHAQKGGFTIIELMIASTIFAIVLLIIVAAITDFLKTYYRSLSNSSTQNTVQSISDSVEQAIEQVSASSSPPVSYTAPSGGQYGMLCIGNIEFAFLTGYEEPTESATLALGSNDILHEFEFSGTCPTPVTSSNAWKYGTSLLGAHYRLIEFNVTSLGSGNSFPGSVIDIKIAYTSGGTNGAGLSLLCSPTLGSNPGGCNSSASISIQNVSAYGSDVRCRVGSGSQFCDVAELQSTVGYHIN